jgi:uncharacterized cupredoxin-like copper-binding protein
MKIPTIALACCVLLASFGGLAHADEGAHAQHAIPKRATGHQTPFGIAGNATNVSRTIDVDMTDEMRFVPAVVDVSSGDTIRFRLRNNGRALHEMVIGRLPDLQKHAASMGKSSTMAHDEPYSAHVEPGGRGEIVWTFNRAGVFNYACLVPGHFEAGMIGKVTVKARG